jgi:hypothetical protein
MALFKSTVVVGILEASSSIILFPPNPGKETNDGYFPLQARRRQMHSLRNLIVSLVSQGQACGSQRNHEHAQ